MRAFRVTYTNGDSYITSANGTLDEVIKAVSFMTPYQVQLWAKENK